MTSKSIISVETLHKMLKCDFSTGILTWRERPPCTFTVTKKRTAMHTALMWNSRFAGKRAFTYIDNVGYFAGNISGKRNRAHRVVFALYNGKWPVFAIDHINGIKTDNQIANLRDVTPEVNSRNTLMLPNNTSGVTGVYFNKKCGKWVAQINHSGKSHSLGLFAEKVDAVLARKESAAVHGYSQRHGTRP